MDVCTKKDEIANAIAAIISSRGSEKIKIQLVSHKHNKYMPLLSLVHLVFRLHWLEMGLLAFRDFGY